MISCHISSVGRIRPLAVALTIGFFATACGGDGANEAQEVATTTGAPTSSTAASAESTTSAAVTPDDGAGEGAGQVADAAPLPPFGTPPTVSVTTNGIDQVTISWQEVADAKGYAIHRDFEFLKWVAAGNSAYLDSEVTAGQEYRCHVRAQDANDDYSEPTQGQRVVVEPPDLLAPSTPPNPVAVLSDDGAHVVLTWEASTDDDVVAGYLVHRNEEFVAFVTEGALTFTDTGVEAGSGYLYEIRAQDPSGNNSEPTPALAIQVP